MKKIFLIIFGFFLVNLSAQNLQDAIRFSQSNLLGTARFNAMGGAFGALGGDLSSLNINPAGSAVFLNGQSAITMSNINLSNRSNYFGNLTRDRNSSFDINQAGASWVFNDYNTKNDWKKISVGINFENTNSFENSMFSSGRNLNNSISDYFTSYANQNGGISLGALKNEFYDTLNFEDQQAFLGYQAFVINPVSDVNDNRQYVSNNPFGGFYDQSNKLIETGYNGKLSFNLATQYKDFLYLGMNLNSHFVDYRSTSSFFENNPNGGNSGLKSVRFDNGIYTYGSGFSFQLGAIIKSKTGLRAGLSYESPTWFRLQDELTQSISTTGFGFGTPANPNLSSAQPDSNYTIGYKSYSLRTPSKYNASLAYTFLKKGIISFDYTLKDFSTIKIGLQSDSRNLNVNQQIANMLTTTNEFRVGTEYKIKQFSLRGGYRFEQSPFNNVAAMGNLTTYSAGFGYNFGETKIDLSYSFARRNQQLAFFSQGFTDRANINARNNSLLLSIIFEL